MANALHDGEREVKRVVRTAQAKEHAAGVEVELRRVGADEIRQKQHVSRTALLRHTVDFGKIRIGQKRVLVPFEADAAALRDGQHHVLPRQKPIVHGNARVAWRGFGGERG
ncbi:hypothetical protein SDC9_198308 [bioreactor metagenome]|uniref:Uncharacterized protein n=1 Tax=bioreactor metagenome TaxID=1076179 RepID=A0A645II69_9ZZZZ